MTTATRSADRRPSRLLSRGLAALAFLLAWGWGEAQLVQTAGAGPQKLMITILEGDGALNNIRERDAREPIVQVTDENHKPVAGALILFTIHDAANGAGASFAGGASTLSVTTGPDGIAHATGLAPRGSGSFTITVAASLGAVVAAEAVIHQSNLITANPGSSSSSGSGTGRVLARVGPVLARVGRERARVARALARVALALARVALARVGRARVGNGTGGLARGLVPRGRGLRRAFGTSCKALWGRWSWAGWWWGQ